MLTLLDKLRRTRLLTLPGLLRLLDGVMTTGVNLMALLRLAAGLHPHRLAIVDEQERLSYPELWRHAEALAGALYRDRDIQPGQKIAIACRNHAAAVKALFAFSRLGAHVFLVNPEMSGEQLLALEARHRFDFYVYDDPLAAVFTGPPLGGKSLPTYHPTGDCVDRMASSVSRPRVRLRKVKTGTVVVMTGGTTGQPKAASRRPSILDYLPPFVALLTQIHLDRYRSAYIATPIYHGFGLASLITGIALGMTMHVTRRFEAERASAMIAENRIELMTLVPLMLQRLLALNSPRLSSLRCVLTGAAPLPPALARESLDRLGPVLFNLYGTSEGGFAIMAGPELIARKPDTIGKPVRGVRARILNESNQEVGGAEIGRLCLRSAWTTSRKDWIETGDLACRDGEGDIFLCGRVDDMIVSGGENVYPIELENVLTGHPDVASAAVVGIPDAEFGQRLKAVVVRREGSTLDSRAVLDWLKPRVSRHQMPAVVEFRGEIPCTSLGKPDKKALRG